MGSINNETIREIGLKNLGIGRKRLDDQLPDEAELGKSTSVWDIYNNYSRKVENERIRDWNDTLNTLLIFAALYSAVLTAFIIESLTLIQEDTSESTRDILLYISNQLANNSSPPFNTTTGPFVAPQWALRVNYCFFFSLCCSLVAALAAVLALQWVGSYDRGLNPSSVEQRALQRQFRREGAYNWKLEHIIASLPTLIFIALLIFFVGLAEWMWNVHHNVAIIVMIGTTIGALFYLATTTISIYSVGAPFRTPVSRYLPLAIGVALSIIPAFIKRTYYAYGTKDLSNHITSFRRLIGTLTSRDFWSRPSQASLRGILSVFSPLIAFDSFEDREIKAVGAIQDVKLSSLFWLSRIISIETYQRQSFVTILKAILAQNQRLKDQIDSHLWVQISGVLRTPHEKKISWKDYSQEELDDAVLTMRGLATVRMGSWKKDEFVPLVEQLYKGYPDPSGMAEILVSWQDLELESMRRAEQKQMTRLKEVRNGSNARDESIHDDDSGKISPDDLPTAHDHSSLDSSYVAVESDHGLSEGITERFRNIVLKSYTHALNNWRESPPEFVIVSLNNINADYSKQSIIPASELFKLISNNLTILPDAITSSDIVPLKILDMLQELITANLTLPPLPPVTLETYLESMSHYFEEKDDEQVIYVYAAILQQTIARLAQIRTLAISDRPTLPDILSRILQTVRSPLWTHIAESWATPILVSMVEPGSTIWDRENRAKSALLMSIALDLKWEFKGTNWMEWWVETMLGFASFVREESYEFAEALFIKHGNLLLAADLPGQDHQSDDEINRLSSISHIGIRLFAMTITKSRDLAQSVLGDGLNKSSDELWTPNEAWTIFIDHCYRYFEEHATVTEIFSRAFAIGSSPELYDRIYRDNITRYLKSTTDLYQYLRSPVLPAVLRHSSGREGITWKMLTAMCGHESFSSEFVNINGLKWLEGFVAERPIRLKEAILIIYQSITKCYGYTDSIAWVVASHKCVETTASSIRDEKISARQIWRSIAPNIGQLVGYLRKRMDEGFKQADIATSQGKVNVVDEEGVTKKDNLIPNKGANAKDPAIKEWSQEEKADFKILVENFTKEVDGIYLLYLKNEGWLNSTSAPHSEFSFLRRLTINQPEIFLRYMYYPREEIFTSSSVALTYFHAPVLEKLIKLSTRDLDSIMKTLVYISPFPWFEDEFIALNGQIILPLILRALWLEEAIKVVNNSLRLVTTPSQILLWLTLARDCLISTGQMVLEPNDDPSWPRYGRMMDYAREDIQEFISWINERMVKWNIGGEEMRGLDTVKSLSMPPPTPAESTLEKHEDHRRERLKEETTQKAPEIWKKIRDIADELVPGLRRGYIVTPVSEGLTCLPRDPEGFCSHARVLLPQHITTKSFLLDGFERLRQDPDGLCSRLDYKV